MDVLGEFLDGRESTAGERPEERLARFDTWARRELAARIDWTWAGPHREKRIEQCRVYLERLVLQMWRRGWMLDGKKLAKHLETVLDNVAAYQKKGKVDDFWAYFRACVDRYVGANAEEIQAEAMRAGAHVGQALAALLAGASRNAGPTLPELLAQRAGEISEAKVETLREKQARARARKASCKADAAQRTLFD